jgi:CRP-like cAMP-binding protein
VKDGTGVVEQGKPPEGLFVVLAGSLVQIDRRRKKEIGDLGLGDVFGGLSLLEGQPSPADVVARGKCWLVVLGEGRFRRILEANPGLERVVRRLAKQSGSTSDAANAKAL